MHIAVLPICKELGFIGKYKDGSGSGSSGGSGFGEQWQWLNEIEDQGIDARREIRWMSLWHKIYIIYFKIKGI